MQGCLLALMVARMACITCFPQQTGELFACCCCSHQAESLLELNQPSRDAEDELVSVAEEKDRLAPQVGRIRLMLGLIAVL